MADDPTGVPPPETPEPPAAPLTLIYLDVDDEITSAAARIRLAGADRVALVLPYGSRLATSRINFRLLAREATERGKQIEIICADASARALALAAGLPVHPSVAALEGRAAAGSGGGASVGGGVAEGGAEMPGGGDEAGAADDTATRVLPLPRRSSPKVPIVGPPRPPVRTRLAVGLGVAIIALVLIGGFLAVELLPSATIVLHPRSEAIGALELTVEARPDVATPDPAGLVIPAARITFNLDASDTFPATGVRLVETKATGNVTFSNFDTGGANRIDAGSVVSTQSGLDFVTLATVTLPNATIEFPFTIVPSTSTVGVEAVVAGPDGNVGNNTITVVPKGENKRLLQVTNKEATSGGEERQATEVSQADVDAARVAIEEALRTQLEEQLTAGTGVPAGVTAFPATAVLEAATWAVDPDTLVGTEATEFDLAATTTASVIGVDPTPIEALLEGRLADRVDPGWTLVAASVQPTIGAPTVTGDVISYPVSIGGTQVRDVDAAALLAAIKGLVLAEARARLDDFGDVEITLWPDWATTIPTRADRITLTVGDPQPSPLPTP